MGVSFTPILEAAMRAIGRAGGLVLVIPVLVLGALAGCGSNSASPGAATPTPPSPSGSPAAPSSPAPVTSASPTAPAPTASVVSSRVSYPWHWPGDVNRPGQVQNSYPVPPLPRLIGIGAGSHPAQQGERAYDRMSFTFTTAFPSYQFTFTKALVADPSGKPIKLAGNGVLKVTFHLAQAHTASGRSSVVVQPPAQLGLNRMVSWAQAGDFEGVVTYGIGVTWPSSQSNPQIPVRAMELEKVTAQGQHLYVVAIDVDATG
jgi:hypothetical protein